MGDNDFVTKRINFCDSAQGQGAAGSACDIAPIGDIRATALPLVTETVAAGGDGEDGGAASIRSKILRLNGNGRLRGKSKGCDDAGNGAEVVADNDGVVSEIRR